MFINPYKTKQEKCWVTEQKTYDAYFRYAVKLPQLPCAGRSSHNESLNMNYVLWFLKYRSGINKNLFVFVMFLAETINLVVFDQFI